MRLAALGTAVAIFDIDEDGAAAVAKAVSMGGRCTNYEVDVSDDVALGAAVLDVAQKAGKIDFLVNCAASFIAAGRDATRSQWDRAWA